MHRYYVFFISIKSGGVEYTGFDYYNDALEYCEILQKKYSWAKPKIFAEKTK